MMRVICARDQRKARATHWHDGQIGAAREIMSSVEQLLHLSSLRGVKQRSNPEFSDGQGWIASLALAMTSSGETPRHREE
jgi:hypothetical protein